MTIRRMRFACWIPEATNTHAECITLIAFPLQQCLYERAQRYVYTYTDTLVSTTVIINHVAHFGLPVRSWNDDMRGVAIK